MDWGGGGAGVKGEGLEVLNEEKGRAGGEGEGVKGRRITHNTQFKQKKKE